VVARKREPSVESLLDRVLDAAADLVARLPPDLALQVEMSLGEVVVLVRGPDAVRSHAPRRASPPPERGGSPGGAPVH
jgi:hypothetical protein